MISEIRAREIDHYFNRDHAARSKHFLITTGISAFAFAFCNFVERFSEPWSFIVAAVLVITTSVVCLAAYRPGKSFAARKLQRAPTLTSEPQINELRRSLALGIPAFAASALIFVLAPRTTEAEEFNKRAQRLLEDGDISAAKKIVNAAAECGIPLNPNVVIANSTPYGEPIPTRDRLAIVRLSNGETIRIWLPVIYVPKGTYKMSRGIDALWGSIVGAGQENTSFHILSGALFNYSGQMLSEALISDLKAFSEKETRAGFLSTKSESSRIAVSNVILDNLRQDLDRVIWIDVVFRGCAVQCAGDWFTLFNVKFIDCQFEFTEGIPETIKSKLISGQSQGISVHLNP
jgi:hypothetical protein